MSDDAAVHRRAVAELRRCERRAGELREFLATFDGLRRPAARSSPRTSPIASADFEALLAEILRAAPRPLARAELLRALQDRGMIFGARRPLRTLGTKLYRARHVARRLPGRGYVLAGERAP